ncbi:MAG TPA: thiol reductant ABC exporter subunit CydD [Candidatus Sulfotelmatobacter sp.]|nr:thiol reductant ABC exporter subunit CydD [Candidatus Sulfotelmatobacter sp.]
MRAVDPRLLRVARAATVALASAVVLGLLTAALATAQAALLADAISRAFLGGASLDVLQPVLAALAFVLGARAATGWAQEVVAQRCSTSVKRTLRRRLLAHAAALGPEWTAGARSGEVVVLATRGLDALDGYFGRYLPQLVLAVVVPVVVLVALAVTDWLAALTVALTVPLIPLFMILIGLATERQRGRRWRALARLAHHFLDVVAGLPTLKVYGRAQAQVAALERATDAYRRETLATLRVAFLSAFALELAATLSVALVAVEMGLRLVGGGVALRTGLFVIVLAPEAYLPLRQLGLQFHASEEGLQAAAAAFSILETPPAQAGGTVQPPDMRVGQVRLDGVTVRRPGRPSEAPWAADLVTRPGEIVVLRGPSGAGKSTLLAVMLGFIAPSEGSARVVAADGRAVGLGDLDLDLWRRQVAWVPQQPFFLAGTVADNVRLAAPDASDTRIAASLSAVGLGEVPLEWRLGERGQGLSSGQRRRLAVARALLRDAPLVLLDEPTAGLDTATEAELLDRIRATAHQEHRAVVLAAHRPAAISIADRIVDVAARLPGAA